MNNQQLRTLVLERSAAYVRRVQRTLAVLPLEMIGELIEQLLVARNNGRTVFVFGNGGSAATATHMVSDLSKTALRPDWPRMRAHALNDNISLLTAWANDVDFSRVFAEQLRTLAHPGDIAIAISGSGNSPNVVAGVEAARELGLFTVGFLGFSGGRLRDMVDLPIVVPIHEYGPVEDIHLVLNHLITAVLNELESDALAAATGRTE